MRGDLTGWQKYKGYKIIFQTSVFQQNLENLRRNHYAPIRHGSPCVTYETKGMRPQGAKRCAPSKATFLIMRSRP